MRYKVAPHSIPRIRQYFALQATIVHDLIVDQYGVTAQPMMELIAPQQVVMLE